MNKELCDCGKEAVWLYMPGYIDHGNPFSCDECVPRGCGCNHRYVSEFGNPDEGDNPVSWSEDKSYWFHVEEDGKEFPCCEYDYNENGYESHKEDENT